MLRIQNVSANTYGHTLRFNGMSGIYVTKFDLLIYYNFLQICILMRFFQRFGV